jgi:hypothetical protein
MKIRVLKATGVIGRRIDTESTPIDRKCDFASGIKARVQCCVG